MPRQRVQHRHAGRPRLWLELRYARLKHNRVHLARRTAALDGETFADQVVEASTTLAAEADPERALSDIQHRQPLQSVP